MAIPGYQIVRKIAQGGMATVYLGVQKSVGREVALKVMSPALSADPGFGDRFYREAKIVGQLSHPNIVSIYDVGSYKQYNYIAMDYLPGAPLPERLRHGLPLAEALRIAREIASALECIHSRGYIHRDIKPDNILFRADGSTVLCDFGISRALKTNLKMTTLGSVLGTPHYMSPEQAQGKGVGPASDIYALGVVFHEMLTGEVPYPGDDPTEVAIRHLTAPLPKLPAELRFIQPTLDRMLAKKPTQRFQSAGEIVRAIERLERSHGQQRRDTRPANEPTAVEVANLVSALFATLRAVTVLKARRLLQQLGGKLRRPGALSASDQRQLDNFVLSSDEGAESVSAPPVTPPARSRNRRFLLPVAVALLLCLPAAWWFLTPTATLGAGDETELPPVAVVEAPAVQPDPPQAAPMSAEPPAETAEEPQTPEPPPEPEPPARYALTVSTEPADANIRILNIRPRYRPGIALEPGAYHIEASAPDYETLERWVRLGDSDLTVELSLQPTRRLLAPGSVIRDAIGADADAGPEMVVLPQGTLELAEGGELALDYPLAIATREVSLAQYARFAADTGRELSPDQAGEPESNPVTGITWRNAMDYAAWLSGKTGSIYRLPSGLEWRYAASAGEGGQYWWGGKDPDGRANCRRGCDSPWSKLFSASSAPVASFAANAFGLHDSAGNVAEWLLECAAGDSESCTARFAAGGSFLDSAANIGSNQRRTVDDGAAAKDIGFRVVLVL